MTFSVQAESHDRFGWIILTLEVSNAELRMILSTGSGGSMLSPHARDDLIAKEILPPQELNQYTLTGVRLGGRPLGDLAVRVLRPSPIWAEADGMLGLDFLRQFTVIHFETSTLRLTLTLS